MDKSDIVYLLLEDHKRLKDFIQQLKDKDTTVAEKRKVYEGFLPLLESHTSAEEETLIARALSEPSLRSQAMEGLEEHDLSEIMALKMKKAASEEQWEARVKVLCESLEHHLKEEEEDFFPVAEEVLSEAERQELGARYSEARQRHELAPIIELPIRTSVLLAKIV